MSLEEALTLNTEALDRVADLMEAQMSVPQEQPDINPPSETPTPEKPKKKAAAKKGPAAKKPKPKAAAPKPEPESFFEPDEPEAVIPATVTPAVEVAEVAQPNEAAAALVEAKEQQAVDNRQGVPAPVVNEAEWYDFCLNTMQRYAQQCGSPVEGMQIAAKHGVEDLNEATNEQCYAISQELKGLLPAVEVA